MKTKTSFIVALILLFSYTAANAQVEIAARAGVNFSNIVWVDDNGGTVSGTNFTPGLHVGVTFDFPLNRDFYIQPGLLFSMKGSKLTGNDALNYYWEADEGYVDYMSADYTSLNAYYIEVPVNFLYKSEMNYGKLYLGAGPYVAFGIGGTYNDYYDGKSLKNKLEFINDWRDQSTDGDIMPYGKKVDAGLNLLVGYEFPNRFLVQLNGQVGLANIEINDAGQKPDGSMRNIGVGISVGYKF